MLRLGLLAALCLTACATTRPSQAGPPSPSVGSADAGVPTGPPRLVFAGNRVLPNDVYLAALGLGEFTADAETAAQIQRKLSAFLRNAGYELSSVHAVAHDNQIDIGINEGRLEKIVFRGRLSVKSLQFTFGMELPHEVFNRPEIERQTAALAKSLDIEGVWFVLVPTAQLSHVGWQLEKLPEIRGFELLHEREPWELHFFFAESAWGNGVGLDLRSSYTDGLEIGVNLMKESLLFKDDRTRIAASGGLGLRNRLSDNGIYPFFSRTAFDGRWYSPPLVADVRPALILKGDLVARQQVDRLIRLENYYAAQGSASLNLSAVARPGLTVSVGGGIQWRRIWGLTTSDLTLPPPTVRFSEQVRGFFDGKFDWVFDPSNNRTDRWHLFAAEAVAFAPGSVFREGKLSDPWFGSVHFRYQNAIQFGWHDLWIRARGRSLFGDVSFHDEDSVAEYNHGIFGSNFIRRGVSAEIEFRFSVTRDLFKISIFHSVFAFGEVTGRGAWKSDGMGGLRPDPLSVYEETPRLGTAVGPGFHALIEGMFQLDIYGSFGILSSGHLAANATLNLNKVF